MTVATEAIELSLLFGLVETLAGLNAEGKLTLVRSAAGWRCALGHGSVLSQTAHSTLAEALRALLIDQVVVEP